MLHAPFLKPALRLPNPRISDQIYAVRPSADSPHDPAGLSESARSRAVGSEYGISAKTVRDIWKRVTWTAATEPLWTDQVPPCATQCAAA
jgi:hypothetical protein